MSILMALELFYELDSPKAEEARRLVLDIRRECDEEQFQTWLREDFGQQAKYILLDLDAED